MKTCILTIGTRGDVQPYIALGLGLKASGHEVTVATLGEFEDLVDHGRHHATLRGDSQSCIGSAEPGKPLSLFANILK